MSTGWGAQAETAADGTFFVTVLPQIDTELTLSSAAYWTRRTWAAAGSTSASPDMLPIGKGFDMPFFDMIFRQQWNGTLRWITQPVVQLWTQEYRCELPNTGMPLCNRLIATETPAPTSFIENVKSVIASDMAEYTGGWMHAALETRTDPAGTVVTLGDLRGSLGIISFAYVNSGLKWPEGSGMTYSYVGAGTGSGGGVMRMGHVQVHDADRADRSVVSHEFAHAVGFFHPSGYDAVPLPSIMKSRAWIRPTDADRLHGRIFYSRPPGNRSPDSDPSGSYVAALAAGPLRFEIVR